jgi:trimethylamine--corrinoid protein Co-methyltransferase
VRLYDQEALSLLAKAGAFISEGNRVRIPAGLVEKAFSTVPKQVALYSRHGQPALTLEGHRCYYGTGSDCLFVRDHRTGERRQAVLEDVIEGMTLCDGLPNVNFVMSMFTPSDVNAGVFDRYAMAAMLNHTSKPIIFVNNDYDGCPDAVEMAELVAGGAEPLRQKPSVACYVNVTSALRHNGESLRKLLFMAEKGLPVLYIPVVTGGMSGPITPAGSQAMSGAAVLTGLVLSQLKREGAPFIMPGFAGDALDMRTMVSPYCAPETKGLAHEMAHYYRLPMFGEGGMSEAKLPDQQASAEAALTLLVASLGGVNLIHDMGYLESGLCGSLIQLAICDELVGWIEHFVAPIEVSEETLALDLIDEVGPDGQFLATEHTRDHYREHWYPSLFERDCYQNWFTEGEKTLAERAADRVKEILGEHIPDSLPEDLRVRLTAIVRRAEARLE